MRAAIAWHHNVGACCGCDIANVITRGGTNRVLVNRVFVHNDKMDQHQVNGVGRGGGQTDFDQIPGAEWRVSLRQRHGLEIYGFVLPSGCTSRGSCNNTLLRRVLRRLSNSKCFLEGFLEGAFKGFQ